MNFRAVAMECFPWAYDRLRAIKFMIDTKYFRTCTVEHLYGGNVFKVNIADRMGRDWYDHDWGRLGEFDLLSTKGLLDGARVFDLGAHQAVVAMMLAKESGLSGEVISVEGSRHNYEVGCKNIVLNDFNNIISIHAVVAQDDGEIFFDESLNGSVTSNKSDSLTKPVRAVTIDGLAKQFGPPNVVFIDIEGHEISALKGAKNTLASLVTWCIEVHGDKILAKYGSKNMDILDFFNSSQSFFYRSDEREPFVKLEDPNDVPHERFFLIIIPKILQKLIE